MALAMRVWIFRSADFRRKHFDLGGRMVLSRAAVVSAVLSAGLAMGARFLSAADFPS
jgi:hypothetical protein